MHTLYFLLSYILSVSPNQEWQNVSPSSKFDPSLLCIRFPYLEEGAKKKWDTYDDCFLLLDQNTNDFCYMHDSNLDLLYNNKKLPIKLILFFNPIIVILISYWEWQLIF